MRFLASLTRTRRPEPGTGARQDDPSDDLTEEQRESVFRRVVLGRWRHAATPSLQEMEHLRQVLPAVLTSDHFPDAEPYRVADVLDALRDGGVAACLRRSGLGLAATDDDATMSLVWLACGEGDGLARLWMVDALGRQVCDAAPDEAARALAVVREHLEMLGLTSRTFAETDVRAIVADVALGPIPHSARSMMRDHEGAVAAHLDGLAALSMGPGWREAHASALQRLGVRALPMRQEPRKEPRQPLPDPDEDFSFSEADDFPVPPPPPPAPPPPGTASVRVVPEGTPFFERHLKPYAALEHALPLLPCADADELADTLASEFPWLAEAVAHVAASQSLRRRGSRPWFAFAPMVLVGSPGAGKTRFLRRLSEIAGIPLTRVNAGGQSGAIEILGHSPTYREAHPSAPVAALAEHAVANPILQLDEVEKFGSSDWNGDPRDALIAMLEPETAQAFRDDFLRVRTDISHVNFAFTANSLGGLPKTLLDRTRVIRAGMPGPEHFDALIDGIVRDVAREHGLETTEAPPLHPRALDAMRRAFRRGTSVRRLKSAVRGALQASAGYAPH